MKKNICFILLIFFSLSPSLSQSDNNKIVYFMRQKNYSEVLKLISKGDNPNICYDGYSILWHAVKDNQSELAKVLIEKGADINWTDENKTTSVFSEVIYKKNYDIAYEILRRDLDLSYRDFCYSDYFEICLSNDDFDFLKYFLSFERNKKYCLEESQTLYSIASYWHSYNPDIYKIIYGTNYKIPDTIPVLLISISEIDALKFFISEGVSANKKYYEEEDAHWYTALQMAQHYKANLLRSYDSYADPYLSGDLKKIDEVINYLNSLQ